ncbi:acyltransferase [Priestia megaterium]
MRVKFQLIQSLKAVVAMLIIFGHIGAVMFEKLNYDFLSIHHLGRTGGVDFFFILSGFLIYYVYQKDIGKKRVNQFLLKRIIRIYPLVWLFTLISIPIYFLVPSFGGGHEKELSVILKSLSLYPQHEPVLGATWSLSHVILFYLIFTLILKKPTLGKTIATLWSISIIVLWIISPSFITKYYEMKFIFSPHNLEFLLGAVASHITLKYKIKFGELFLLAGTAGFIFTWLNTLNSFIPLEVTIGYSLSSLCIILGAYSIDSQQKLKINKLIDVFGNSSYSIIITNLPFIILFAKAFDALNVFDLIGYTPAIVILIILTMIGGVTVHMLIENPISSHLKKRLIKPTSKKQVSSINQTA